MARSTACFLIPANETDFRIVECFDASKNTCTLTPHFQLKRVIQSAQQYFMAELDKASRCRCHDPCSGWEGEADGLNYIATWNAAMMMSQDLTEAMTANAAKRPAVFKD